MRRIGLVVHGGRPAAVQAAGIVRDWAQRHGVDIVDMDVWAADRDRQAGHPHPGGGHPPGRTGPPLEDRSPAGQAPRDGSPAGQAPEDGGPGGGARPDLIVTVGGDGTFLRGARVAAAAGAPVLGVNVGRVGFLTEVEPGDVRAALDAFAEGRAETERRLTLTLRTSRPLEIPSGVAALLRYGRGPWQPPAGPVVAVNDVVFERLTRDRQADLAVYLDGRPFAAYSADALIVASPTGSTAYSFAAGGPVLSPRLNGLVVTPVAPHMVFNRSLVLGDEEPVGVRVLDRSGQVAVSVDGQLRGVLDPGDWVVVHAGTQEVRLVRLHPADFYGRLRHRFSLADAPAARDDGQPPPAYRAGTGTPLPPEVRALFPPR